MISHGTCRCSDPIAGAANTLLIRSGDGPVLIHPDVRSSEAPVRGRPNRQDRRDAMPSSREPTLFEQVKDPQPRGYMST